MHVIYSIANENAKDIHRRLVEIERFQINTDDAGKR